MRAGFNQALLDRIRRSDPTARPLFDLTVVEASDEFQTADDWNNADSTTGFTVHDDGSLTLSKGSVNIVSNTTSTDWITDLGTTSTFDVARIEIADPAQEIHTVTAWLHPDRDGVPGNKQVSKFGCQVFRLHEVLNPGLVDQAFLLAPVTGEVRVTASGTVAADFNFDFFTGSRPPVVGAAPINGSKLGLHKPVIYIFIKAYQADGSDAGNVGWGIDTGSSSASSGGNTLTGIRLIQDQDGTYLESTSLDLPRVTVTEGSYSAATITFTSTLLDLGAGPSASVECVAHVQLPPGTSATFEIDDDTSTPFTGGEAEFVFGDIIGQDNSAQGGNDLTSINAQQQYAVRATLTPDAAGVRTPRLLKLGVLDRSATTFDAEVEVDPEARVKVDPPTLKGEIAQLDLRLPRSGVRDYGDAITSLLSENDLDSIDVRMFWGHPDLDRKEWGHVETFVLDDYTPEPDAIVLHCLSPLILVRGVFPVYDTIAEERQHYIQSGATIKTVWADILSEIAVPNRFLGQPPEDSTTISKVVSNSEAKSEFDAVARLALCGNISSQGRIKAVNFGATVEQVDAIWVAEEIAPLSITPGFRFRSPEYFVPYGYSPDSGEYAGESRYHDANALLKLGYGHDVEVGIEPDISAQWIDSEAHADVIALQQASWFGTGLMLWPVEVAYPYPELEPGDVVAIPTDQFVAHDPQAARNLKGHVYAIAVIAAAHFSGRRFEVWVQGYTDIFAIQTSVGRTRANGPDATEITSGDFTETIRQGGFVVDVNLNLTDVGGVGARTVALHASAISGFTPGSSNLIATARVGPDETTVVFTGLDPARLGGYHRPIYFQVGVTDELSATFAESTSYSGQLTGGNYGVVYFTRLGGAPLSTSTIVGLFTFEEGTGTAVQDLAEHGDATITTGSGDGWVDSPTGGAYDLNESATIAAAEATSTSQDIGASQDATFDLVFRWDGSGGGTNQILLYHDNDYGIRLNPLTGDFFLQILMRDYWLSGWGTGDVGVFSDWNVVGRWVHVKVQYDAGAGTLTWWLNGRRFAVTSATGTVASGSIGNTLYIGHDNSANSEFNGALSYVRIAKGLLNDFPGIEAVRANQEHGDLLYQNTVGATAPTGESTHYVDATSTNRTLTLPPVASGPGRITVVKVDSSSNTVTVDGDGSETINGSTTHVLSSQYDTVTVEHDGTEWYVV